MTEYTCIRCGATRLEGDEAAGHIPGDPATCTDPQLCIRCGAVIENALGHDYAEEVTEPTCTEMGYTTYTCTRCGDAYKGDSPRPQAHKPATGSSTRSLPPTARAASIKSVRSAAKRWKLRKSRRSTIRPPRTAKVRPLWAAIW